MDALTTADHLATLFQPEHLANYLVSLVDSSALQSATHHLSVMECTQGNLQCSPTGGTEDDLSEQIRKDNIGFL